MSKVEKNDRQKEIDTILENLNAIKKQMADQLAMLASIHYGQIDMDDMSLSPQNPKERGYGSNDYKFAIQSLLNGTGDKTVAVMSLKACEETIKNDLRRLQDEGTTQEEIEPVLNRLTPFRENLTEQLSTNKGLREFVTNRIEERLVTDAIPFILGNASDPGTITRKENEELTAKLKTVISLPTDVMNSMLQGGGAYQNIPKHPVSALVRKRIIEVFAVQGNNYDLDRTLVTQENIERFSKLVEKDIISHSIIQESIQNLTTISSGIIVTPEMNKKITQILLPELSKLDIDFLKLKKEGIIQGITEKLNEGKSASVYLKGMFKDKVKFTIPKAELENINGQLKKAHNKYELNRGSREVPDKPSSILNKAIGGLYTKNGIILSEKRHEKCKKELLGILETFEPQVLKNMGPFIAESIREKLHKKAFISFKHPGMTVSTTNLKAIGEGLIQLNNKYKQQVAINKIATTPEEIIDKSLAILELKYGKINLDKKQVVNQLNQVFKDLDPEYVKNNGNDIATYVLPKAIEKQSSSLSKLFPSLFFHIDKKQLETAAKRVVEENVKNNQEFVENNIRRNLLKYNDKLKGTALETKLKSFLKDTPGAEEYARMGLKLKPHLNNEELTVANLAKIRKYNPKEFDKIVFGIEENHKRAASALQIGDQALTSKTVAAHNRSNSAPSTLLMPPALLSTINNEAKALSEQARLHITGQAAVVISKSRKSRASTPPPTTLAKGSRNKLSTPSL